MRTDFERALLADPMYTYLQDCLVQRRRAVAKEIGLTSLGWFGVSCSRHPVKNIAESRLGGTEIKIFVCVQCTSEESSFSGDEERHVLSVPTIFGYFCPHGCGNVKSKPNQKTISAISCVDVTTYSCVVCEKELGVSAQ